MSVMFKQFTVMSVCMLLMFSACKQSSSDKENPDLNQPEAEVPLEQASLESTEQVKTDEIKAAAKPAVDLNDFLIKPDLKHAGIIEQDSSYESLEKRVGKKHIKRTDVYIAEGFCESGALLYPNDSRRQVEIFWGDKINESHPTSVQISSSDSWWKLPYDIGIGTSAMTLYKLNGKTFSFAGTGWDYGGYIHHWTEGNLDAPLIGVSLRLAEILVEEGSEKSAPALLDEKNYSRILGDQTVDAFSVQDLLGHLEISKIGYTFLDNQARFPDEDDSQHTCHY